MKFLSVFLAAATANAALVTQFPPPDQDPFYNTPKRIDLYQPGAVVRHRQVLSIVGGRSVKSFQTLYRTNDSLNKSLATVATIWKPAEPISPPKIFSWQQTESALNIDCAPSWGYVNASSSMSTYYQQPSWLVEWALSQGYYVVYPDFEGPRGELLVARTGGQASLDGIRSAINFLGLQNASSVLFGYATGASPSAWAAGLAATYAPELDIVGAAFGATVIDPVSAYNQLNGGTYAIFAGAGQAGIANGYPEFNKTLQSILTDQGKQIFAKLNRPDQCTFAPGVLQQYIGFNFSTLFTKNEFDVPEINNTLNAQSLLSDVNPDPVPVPKFPRFQWHGQKDQTSSYPSEAKYVQQQCSAGADIRFVSFPDYAGVTSFEAGVLGALQFTNQAFSGTVQPATCGANVTVPSLGSAQAVQLVGYETSQYLVGLFRTAQANNS